MQRIAIVNRGDAAARFVISARELPGITTIALYSDPDRRATFVRDADESFALGAPAAYTDLDRLAEALRRTRADAAWVGWGLVAENPVFAELCGRLGVTFIGPRGEVMRRLADKINAKRLAESVGVPVAPWSGGAVDSVDEAREHARRLGYPLLVKASSCADGRGVRRVASERELADAFEDARRAAQRSADPRVFVEALLEGVRHVDVQIVADRHGAVWALGTRDCTLQRGCHKLVLEAPACLPPDVDAELRDAAVRMARVAEYENVGTVEFLWQPATRRIAMLEVNARLDLSHAVTEATTGVDLVKLQLLVAGGGRLVGPPPPSVGHAIELHLLAEDPEREFAPAGGRLERFRLPGGAGVRIDSGYGRDDLVRAEIDPLIAKIITSAPTREEALARARRALSTSAVVLRGGATNKGFLLELLGRPEVQRDEHELGWVDRVIAAGEHVSTRGADVAVVRAAIEAYEAETGVDKQQFARTAARGRPVVPATAGASVELKHRGHDYALRVRHVAPDRYAIAVDGAELEVTLDPLAPSEVRLVAGGQRFRVLSLTDGAAHLVEVDGVPHRVTRDDAGLVRALAPGMVVSVAVRAGDLVAAGDRLVVLEAMKSYIEIAAEQAGRVREVLVVPNMQVSVGRPLLVIDAQPVATAGAPAPRLSFDGLAMPPQDGWRRALEDLRSLILGYDVDATAVRDALVASAADAPPERRDVEDELLETFADLLALFRRRAASTDDHEEGARSSATEHFYAYLRDLAGRGEGLPASYLERLRRALSHYGVESLERTPELHESLFRIVKARGRLDEQVAPVLAVLSRRIEAAGVEARSAGDRQREVLDQLIAETHAALESVCDHAREVRYLYFERALLDASRSRLFEEATAHLAALERELPPHVRRAHVEALAAVPHPLLRYLSGRLPSAGTTLRHALLQVLVARYYEVPAGAVRVVAEGRVPLGVGDIAGPAGKARIIAAHEEIARLGDALAAAGAEAARADCDVYIDVYLWDAIGGESPDAMASRLAGVVLPANVRGVVIAVSGPGRVVHLTLKPGETGLVEQRHLRGLHPTVGRRLQLWRLSRFELERLPSSDELFLFRARGRENRDDERLIALAEVRDLTAVRDAAGRLVALPHLERVLGETLATMRLEQLRRPARERTYWNRVQLFVRPPFTLPAHELDGIVRRLARATHGLGLERILVRARIPGPDGALADRVIDLFNPGAGVTMVIRDPPTEPMDALSAYAQKVIRLRQQGLTYPYEIVAMLTGQEGKRIAGFPPGEFIEHDLDAGGELAPVERPPGENQANIVVGVIKSFTPRHPEGMTRVILLGDPSKEMGSLAEPECRRINAALALATRLGVPVEWFALSAGAKIAIDSGSENMDWIALTLRRIIELTQRGGEINVIVDGINVGAQPYWNAEATMLMHTRGILVMTHQGAMVLTGKRALDYSGGVSADDNSGIGGYERIMGPNGQAQYHAGDLAGACRILFAHYDHTYVAPGERFPRRAPTADPPDRDVLGMPHARGLGFTTVGEIFSNDKNPGRKRPFDVRSVLSAAIDQDHAPLERWFGQRGAEMAVVWDAHLGGWPVCLLGIESRPLPRLGLVPADGPEQYTPGTLFPQASKKIARAINAASGNRPVVVLANLTGFDGSPESMRELQLEYGAEIGRAVVNFRGPIVFCVISRYHGGAFVVFSAKLNDDMEVAALEGSYASVIGGAPAAAVVFAREVDKRARRDARLLAIEEELRRTEGPARVALTTRRGEVWKAVHSEMLGRVADEFDQVHSVQRAQRMGSVHKIIAPVTLRPYLIDALERGMARARP